jgi:hypothetical protein
LYGKAYHADHENEWLLGEGSMRRRHSPPSC